MRNFNLKGKNSFIFMILSILVVLGIVFSSNAFAANKNPTIDFVLTGTKVDENFVSGDTILVGDGLTVKLNLSFNENGNEGDLITFRIYDETYHTLISADALESLKNASIDLSDYRGEHTFYYRGTFEPIDSGKYEIGENEEFKINFKEYVPASISTTVSNANGNYFLGNVETSNKSKLKVDFEVNDDTDLTYGIYANNTLISNSAESDSKEFDLSVLLDNKNISGNVNLTYKLSNSNTEVVIGNYNFIKADSTITSEITKTGINNRDYLYGTEVPDKNKNYLNFSVSNDIKLTTASLVIKANNTEIGKYTGTDVYSDKNIDLSTVIKSANNYTFTYELKDGINATKTGTIASNINFKAFEEATITSEISGGINNTYYTGYVASANKTRLDITFNQKDNIGATYNVYANNTLIAENKSISDVINLSSLKVNKSYLSGDVTFEYQLSSSSNKVEIGTYTFVEHTKPSFSKVEVTKTGITNRDYLYGTNVPENQGNKLIIETLNDSNILSKAKLIINFGDFTKTYTGLDAFNNQTINLSNEIKSAGNYTLSYTLDDGIGDVITVSNGGTYNFKEFEEATITSEISGGINNTYYTGYVASANKTRLDITFNQKDNIGATYNVYANNILIAENKTASSTIELSDEIDGAYLSGNVKFTYTVSSRGSSKETHEVSGTFIVNDKPSISNISVVSAKNNIYLFGTNANITDALKTRLYFNISDNVQKDGVKSNISFEIKDGNTSIYKETGDTILGNKEINLSTLIKSAGNKNLNYILYDGIGDAVTATIGTYNFVQYQLPSITSRITGGVTNTYYTNYVSDKNKTIFNATVVPQSYNTLTSYEIFIGTSNSDKVSIKTVNVSTAADLSTTIDLSTLLMSNKYLNGEYSFFYKLNFAENTNSVTGEFSNLTNTTFIENNTPVISGVQLQGTQNNTIFYTKDVKESLRTKLNYTIADADNKNNLKVIVYEDKDKDGDYKESEKITKLSTASGYTGTKIFDFTEESLYHNNETNVSLRYRVDDGIGDVIDREIGTFNFTSNTKPELLKTNDIYKLDITNTFGNDLTIYYGEVATDHKALLNFETSKEAETKAYLQGRSSEFGLNKDGNKYSATLSDLTSLRGGTFGLAITLDDGIADTQIFYPTKSGSGIIGSLLTAQNGNTVTDAYTQSYKFPFKVNVAPVLNITETKIVIPSENNGVIYTQDVRTSKKTSFTIKVDDAEFVTSDLYKVNIGEASNFQFKEGYTKDNNSHTYDLSNTTLDGNKELSILLDDGIADPKIVNILGKDIATNGTTSLTFSRNEAPKFEKLPLVSNITDNQIFYGDVNVPERISVLTFKPDEECKYTINHSTFYTSKDPKALFEEGSGNYIGTEISYNVTAHDFSKYGNNNTFYITVALDDGIAEIQTANSLRYSFIKNEKPTLNGSVDYGSNNGKAFRSIFVGLDNSANINQDLNLNLTEDSVNVGNYVYKLYQGDKHIDDKESMSSAAPNFDLADYGKRNLFDVKSGSNLRVSYTDGIWDSSIANSDLVFSNINFTKADKPKADASLTGGYDYENKYYIFDMSMNPTYAGDKVFEDVEFSVKPSSSNEEISLSKVALEFTMTGAEYQSANGWSVVTGSDRLTSLFTINDFESNSGAVIKSWLNNTGNDNKPVKFRLRIEDELKQEAFIPINETDSFTLAREYAPGYPSRFLMYEGDSLTPSSNYTLEVGKEYRFDWSKASDVNITQGDEISKYIFTYTGADGIPHEQSLEPLNANPSVAGSYKWTCTQEGSASFSVESIDKFGRKSRAKVISKDSIQNTAPNDISPSSIQSTYTSFNGLDYLKVYTSDNSASQAETTYKLSWINAGDMDDGDYVSKWIIEYSTDNNTWHQLGVKDNTGNIVKEGETVNYNYTLRSSLDGLAGANNIAFRITAYDTRNSESSAMEGNSYKFTSDNVKPNWSNLDSISFNSEQGYVIDINAIVKDTSEISYVTINDENIPFEVDNDGIHFSYTVYRNGKYNFRIADIYNNVLATNQTVTGIDAIPPTIELVPGESNYTNEPYILTISAIDSLTGIELIKIDYTDIDGKVTHFESNNEFVKGTTQVNFSYTVRGPGKYDVTVFDRADNEATKSIEIDNINLNKPTATYSMPEGLQDRKVVISLDATVSGTKLTSTLGSWSVLQTSTIKNYNNLKSTSVDATDATITVNENGILNMAFTDIFGNVSDTLSINVNNVLEGEVNNTVKYLMLESDYKANYSDNKEVVVVNGVRYVEWNNQETTNCQLFGYIKVNADFNGLQYAWLDTSRSGTSNCTYTTSYANGDINHPDAVLFKFNSARKAFYIVDIFGNVTQSVLTINGYVAPPSCEIKYEYLTEGISSEGVDVYFTITAGTFVDNGFYNVTVDGITKNLFDEFVWGSVINGTFIEDNSFRGKSFKYTFTENGSLKVWGQSASDDTDFAVVNVTVSTIDKSVPIVSINEFNATTPIADKLVLTASTNGEFISLDELKVQLDGLGYGLSEDELNSYTVSENKKEASITLTHNVSGIFFYAKNEAGTMGNSNSVSINNIYESNLSLELWVYFEDESCMTYEEYLNLEDKSIAGPITVKAISSNTSKDNNGTYILRRFEESENPGCIITDSSYTTGGNMVTASYTFTEAGSYTFKLRDAYTGYLEKTVTIGKIIDDSVLPTIDITTENIRGEGVPYIVSVKITATTTSESAYFLDDEGNATTDTTVSKTVFENGTYTFKVSDKFGNTVEKSITISNIFTENDKPVITITYEKGFTNKNLLVKAVVSNGKFVNVPSDWNTVSEINGSPVSIQKVFVKNEKVTLTAKNFYDDATSEIQEIFEITNIDTEAPAKASIDSSITNEGLLNIEIIDNGDYGTSKTAKFEYSIYSDACNYKQSGECSITENNVVINASDVTYKDGRYIISIKAIDNAGNISEAALYDFECNNSLVKDFMSTYNTIIASSNIEDMKDFFVDLIAEARAELSNYTNEVQRQFVSDKCDLLDEILDTGDSEQVILISKIEGWLKDLAKNPSDKTFLTDLKNAINSLSNTELQKKYQLQLDALLNQSSVISLKQNAPSEFNFALGEYIINPLGGITYRLNIAGYIDENGEFVRGISSDDFYYLNGNKIMIDFTFQTFVDINGNTINTKTGLVNENKYYDSTGNLVDEAIAGGFYDATGGFHKTNWNGGDVTDSTTYVVEFVDYDGTVLSTQTVNKGENATAPATPEREGYTFSKWDKSFTNVSSNLTITAIYVENGSGTITPTPGPTPTETPVITPTPGPDDDEKVIAVKSITLDRTSANIKVNESLVLNATINPSNATDQTITWTSSNNNVAVVDRGVVIPLVAGSTRITATTSNKLTASCLVSVASAGTITDDEGTIIIPPSGDFPNIDDIVTPTPSNPDQEVSNAPAYNTSYLGSLMVGLTSQTDFNAANLRGFYNQGLSTLLIDGSGNLDIANKKNAYVNLGFKGGSYALVMSSIDINSSSMVSSFGLNTSSGTVSINGNGNTSYGLGNNSYLVVFSSYSSDLTVARNGKNIACDYDYDLQGYRVSNPCGGTYTLQPISSSNIAPTDMASRYGFTNDTYSNPITYKEVVKMAYNALNRDSGEELFSSIDKNSEIYREASILQKYGVIDYVPSNINSAVGGKDAYDILYMTLSQTNPSNLNYNVSDYRYKTSVSLQDLNNMIANIVQYF